MKLQEWGGGGGEGGWIFILEAVAEDAKVTRFFKVGILRPAPAQNQQGCKGSCKPHLRVGESTVARAINWP